MAILPAFLKFKNEAAIIGRLLAGYADLEIDLMHCVQVVRDDLDTVLKTMFRTRGNAARIDVADALGRQHYQKLALDPEFASCIAAVRYCLRIRNQYAHCIWYDDNTGVLAFVNLEEIAKGSALISDLKNLTVLHTDMLLLQAQVGYFEYTDNSLTWLNYEGRYRAGKLKAPIGPAVAAATQPTLSMP